jgi:hypothetical protein
MLQNQQSLAFDIGRFYRRRFLLLNLFLNYGKPSPIRFSAYREPSRGQKQGSVRIADHTGVIPLSKEIAVRKVPQSIQV